MPQMAEADLIAAVKPANAGNTLSIENDPVAIVSNTYRYIIAVITFAHVHVLKCQFVHYWYLTIAMSPADISHSTKRDDPYLHSFSNATFNIIIANLQMSNSIVTKEQEKCIKHKNNGKWNRNLISCMFGLHQLSTVSIIMRLWRWVIALYYGTYSACPFFSPPNAITVLIDDSISCAMAPALATAVSLVALDVAVI